MQGNTYFMLQFQSESSMRALTLAARPPNGAPPALPQQASAMFSTTPSQNDPRGGSSWGSPASPQRSENATAATARWKTTALTAQECCPPQRSRAGKSTGWGMELGWDLRN
jgi:hypothetical protein